MALYAPGLWDPVAPLKTPLFVLHSACHETYPDVLIMYKEGCHHL